LSAFSIVFLSPTSINLLEQLSTHFIMQPKTLVFALLGGSSVIDVAVGMPKAELGSALERAEVRTIPLAS
jgi:hypothetical protein